MCVLLLSQLNSGSFVIAKCSAFLGSAFPIAKNDVFDRNIHKLYSTTSYGRLKRAVYGDRTRSFHIHQCARGRRLPGVSIEPEDQVFSLGMAFSGLQIRVRIGKLIPLLLIQNICCGYSKEPSQ